MATKKYTWTTSSDYTNEINNQLKALDTLAKPADFVDPFKQQNANWAYQLGNWDKYYSQQANLNNARANYQNAVNNGVDLTKNAGYQQEYNNYVNDYTRRGERAMRDTLGKLASRTGGMASSYATAAAQQAYGNYMDELASKINDLSSRYRQEQMTNLKGLLDYYTGDKSNAYGYLSGALDQSQENSGKAKTEWDTNYKKNYTDEIERLRGIISELQGQQSFYGTIEENERDREFKRELAELEAQKAQLQAQTQSSKGSKKNWDDDDDDDEDMPYVAPEASDRIWVDGTAFGLRELLRGEAEGWFTRDANGNWKSVPKYDSIGVKLRNPYTGR